LAERARLSARAISDLERGLKETPHATTVHLLVQALGLNGAEADAFATAARRRVLTSAPPAARQSPGRVAKLRRPPTSILLRSQSEPGA